MSIPENITRLDEQLTDLKTTCTVFQTASIALLAPVVVTSWLTRDRRDTPTRITTGLLVSVVLLSTTVLLGSTMDYRIPNPNNEIVAMFTGIALVDRDWCKTQAIAYVPRCSTRVHVNRIVTTFSEGTQRLIIVWWLVSDFLCCSKSEQCCCL